MPATITIVRNLYRDSVSLMQLSAALERLPGVEQASVGMATPANIELMRDAGLLTGSIDAGSGDILIALKAASAAALATGREQAEKLLKEEAKPATGADGPAARLPQSIAMAIEAMPTANLALISTPGDYAAAEAKKAIMLGLNVMLFSDNVDIADEVALKALASERNLLVMGPDCGTAIVNGVPLAFANVVRRGTIGCIGASGTGLQQVTCLIDRLGLGISQAIGTGSRDLKTEVGGVTMLAALEALAKDRATRVIVLISKPPAEAVAKKVLAAAARLRKPVVVNFIGMDPAAITGRNLTPARTLEDAAHAAVALAQGAKVATRKPRAKTPKLAFGAKQRYVRGLYSGGTFCYEATLLLGAALGKVWSNTPVKKEDELPDVWKSREHTVIDLGDDAFTRGRPHPMIDHRLRNERIVREATDPSVAVILLDVVLGHGSHADPAGAMIPAIESARAKAAKKRSRIAFVAFVCGTPGDLQGLEQQEAALAKAGVHLAPSNAAAVRLAAAIALTRGGRAR